MRRSMLTLLLGGLVLLANQQASWAEPVKVKDVGQSFRFPVSGDLTLDLDLGFGEFPFTASVSTAATFDALAARVKNSTEILQMSLTGVGNLFGDNVPISVTLGSQLGQPATLGMFDETSSTFNVFFLAEVQTPGPAGLIAAYNNVALALRADGISDANPFAAGTTYTSQNSVDIFNANANDALIGTISNFSFTISANQSNPSLPTSIGGDGAFVFEDVVSGLWFDPPFTDGFRYEMTGGSLFTDILGFPTGFGNLEVIVNGISQGFFNPGDTFTFGGGGVSSFEIRNISPLVDAGDPIAFPLQLGFDTPTASFTMSAVQDPTAVPEPSTFALLGIGGVVLGGIRWRRRNRKAA